MNTRAPAAPISGFATENAEVGDGPPTDRGVPVTDPDQKTPQIGGTR